MGGPFTAWSFGQRTQRALPWGVRVVQRAQPCPRETPPALITSIPRPPSAPRPHSRRGLHGFPLDKANPSQSLGLRGVGMGQNKGCCVPGHRRVTC